MSRFIVLLATACVAAAALAGVEAPPAPSFAPEQVWRIPLRSPLAEAPRPLVVDGDSVLLLAYPEALELRRAGDGSLIWRRDDLGAAGLQREPPSLTRGGWVLGWAGMNADSAPRLVVFDLRSGENRALLELPRPPSGPPRPRPRSDALPRWDLPLGEEFVATIDSDGRLLTTARLPAPLASPLLSLEGHLAAVAGKEQRLLLPFSSGSKLRARGLRPDTVAIDGSWLWGGNGRTFEAWRCRKNRRGNLRCRRRWRQLLGGSITAPPALTPTLVLVPSWNTFLYAFHRENGHLLWRAGSGLRLPRTPRVSGSMVLVVAGGREVQAFHIDSGARAGRLPAGPAEHFPLGLSVADGLFFVPAITVPMGKMTLRAFRTSAPTDRPPPAGGATSKNGDRGQGPSRAVRRPRP